MAALDHVADRGVALAGALLSLVGAREKASAVPA
jgi:hypothetical protein